VVSTDWFNLEPNTEYEWKVLVDDGDQTTSGPLWSFTTGDHRINLKVYLEGPYEEGLMNTENSEIIPLSQPFTGPPWNYTGTENVSSIPTGIVDWVLIELRDAIQASAATSETMLTRFAAFLKEDGTVTDLDGNTLPSFSLGIQDNLFVVIRHRNHLSIMSSEPLIHTSGVFEYDFTTEASKSFGGMDAVKSLPGGFWGMISGDFNADGIIDETDKAQWDNQSGQSGFLSSDQNLNGEADNVDKNEGWLINLNREAQLPD
jgi:hypothetical protein